MVIGKKSKTSEEKKQEEYQKLGQMIESMYDAVNPNRAALYRASFVKGLWSGLGGIIGATVGIAVLLWILSLFGQIPLIGHFVDTIRHTLQNRR